MPLKHACLPFHHPRKNPSAPCELFQRTARDVILCSYLDSRVKLLPRVDSGASRLEPVVLADTRPPHGETQMVSPLALPAIIHGGSLSPFPCNKKPIFLGRKRSFLPKPIFFGSRPHGGHRKLNCAIKNSIRKFYTIIFYVGITRLVKQKQHLILYPLENQGEIKLILKEAFEKFN